MTFEQIGQNRGFVLYETAIEKLFTDPAELAIDVLHDRANVYVNAELRGILSRAEKVSSMPLSGNCLHLPAYTYIAKIKKDGLLIRLVFSRPLFSLFSSFQYS